MSSLECGWTKVAEEIGYTVKLGSSEGLDAVPGGEILRDSSGQPTGIFVDAAQSLVPVPKWSRQQMREYADRAIKDALAVGLTSVHDAATSVEEFELFKQYVPRCCRHCRN